MHTRTFTNPTDAIEFVGTLERGAFMGLSHVVEQAMEPPKVIKSIRSEKPQPRLPARERGSRSKSA
jgi:hypothetical protein